MLKGIPTIDCNYSKEIVPSITSVSVVEKSLPLQDTSKTIQQKRQQLQTEINLPKIGATKKNIDSISVKNNLREKTIQIKDFKPQNENIVSINEDTSSSIVYDKALPFQHKRTDVDNLYSNNFLLGIPNKNISQHFDTSLLPHKNINHHIQKEQNQIEVKASVVHEKSGFKGNLRTDASLDWLPAILLISLFTFSWIKLLYQKYIIQVVASMVNYQASIRLLRERNVLFRNMALGLNLIFAINAGLFIFYILQYRELRQILPEHQFLSVLIYSFGIILLFGLKAFVCKVLGNIFMVKEQFSEYVHNIYLNIKNIGLFLFPIVIFFPYINDQIKPIVIFLGLTVVIGMFLLLLYRGFQIIMRNEVSIFYLILYLCAIEILPVLLLLKYSYTLI